MGEKWKAGIIEDEKKYRDYISELFRKEEDCAGVISWKSAEEFWRDESGTEVDVLYIDIMLPHMNGVELTRMINERNPEIPKVMLTNLDSEQMIFKALKNGAIGYLLKSELDDILKINRTILSGGGVITPTIALHVLNSFKESPPQEGRPNLTTRETQVLELVIRGITKKKAAERLGISEDTLRWHVKNIYKKLNVNTKLELLKESERLGLI